MQIVTTLRIGEGLSLKVDRHEESFLCDVGDWRINVNNGGYLTVAPIWRVHPDEFPQQHGPPVLVVPVTRENV